MLCTHEGELCKLLSPDNVNVASERTWGPGEIKAVNTETLLGSGWWWLGECSGEALLCACPLLVPFLPLSFGHCRVGTGLDEPLSSKILSNPSGSNIL